MTPLVVLSGRTLGGERPGWGVPTSYVAALERAGLAGVAVGEGGAGVALIRAGCGLLLPGGPDVDPARYGQARHETTEVHPGLDDLEFALLAAALEEHRPVLGICRGVQVLNVALGGTLLQDLPSQRPGGLEHQGTLAPGEGPRDAWHGVRLSPASRTARAMGAQAEVTSWHHQALDRLADGLVATGWAADGVVEAVELEGSTFVVGVQFHPERMAAEDASGLFAAFADALRSGAPGLGSERRAGVPAASE